MALLNKTFYAVFLIFCTTSKNQLLQISVLADICVQPQNFPQNIPLYEADFMNYPGVINVPNVWTFAPRTPDDVVTVVNWARSNNVAIRPRGSMHNWSPLILAAGTPPCPNNVILADTMKYLTSITINSGLTPKSVTAQTGITMDKLFEELEQAGLGMAAIPALGEITLGGALAIGAHGTAIPNSIPLSGQTYGTLSNLILSLTAVVYSSSSDQYVLRTFQRSDSDIGAFLVHVGRAFITEVTLMVATNEHIRCQSFTDIPAEEIFAVPGSDGYATARTFASFLPNTRGIESIWFPFTSCPWLKVWSVRKVKPLLSRAVYAPYNYPFINVIPQQTIDLLAQLVAGNSEVTPLFTQAEFLDIATGLLATFSFDIWGWSKNVLLYVKSPLERVVTSAYVILTIDGNVQRVVSEFFTQYQELLTRYQNQGMYPMNGALEIRVSGLDNPNDIRGSINPTQPFLSANRQRPDHAEWTIAIWFECDTIPGTPYSDEFYADLESWLFSNYVEPYATVRAEWSKGWAFTNNGPFTNLTVINNLIPNSLTKGQSMDINWDAAKAILQQYDPFKVYSSPLLQTLFN